MKEIFDDWPVQYDQWFETGIGRLIKVYESRLVREMLGSSEGELILDAGCGTGIFTKDLLSPGSRIIGLDLSLPMLMLADKNLDGYAFTAVQGDMADLPFMDGTFDKVLSITAIEFTDDAKAVINEFLRVTRPGGSILVATLNSLSPWALRRKEAGEKGHPIFRHAIFRSPDEMSRLTPIECEIKTAIHFQKHDSVPRAVKIEEQGSSKCLQTGAFLAARWIKSKNS